MHLGLQFMHHQDAAGSCRAEPIVMPPNNRVHNSLVVRFPRHHQGHLEKRHEKYLPKDKPISSQK